MDIEMRTISRGVTSAVKELGGKKVERNVNGLYVPPNQKVSDMLFSMATG